MSRLRHFIYIFLAANIITGCVPSSYKMIYEGQIVSPEDQNSRKLVVFLNSYGANSDHLTKAINSKDWIALENELRIISDEKLRGFLTSIQLMIRGQFQGAYDQLNILKETDFDCQVKILKADCLFELKAHSKVLFKEYQDAFDCSVNQQVKSIALTRYRFVKYGI